MARILVLGGGFGGLAAAHRLRDALDEEHEITLVDRRDRFFIGLVKLWDMVGIASLEKESRSLRGLETKGIKFLQADITDLDPEVRRVETSAGTLSADFMVVALGAAFFPGHTEMLQGSAHHLYDAGNLPAIRRDLATIQEGRIVIGVMGVPYKCPPAPYEAALLIDDLLRGENKRDRVEISVYTPQPSPLPVAGRKGSALVSAALGEKGIALHTEHQITGIEGSSGSVSFANGTSAEFTLFLGVAQHVAPAVVANGSLAGKGGWIAPDPRTMKTRFDGVYAAGDCTAIPISKGQLPKAGIIAEGAARVAADNIIAELTGTDETGFDGRGMCFLEIGGGRAAYVEGNFYAQPEPDVEVAEPTPETFRRKEEFVRERLRNWL
jgi:sulfide:quinone oxidoreductase